MLNFRPATGAPAAPLPAAALMLLRPAARGGAFEVFMVERSAKLRFMPGALVFPGGRVDPADAQADLAALPGADAPVGDAPAQLARALRIAALREGLEESGVLPCLAHTPDAQILQRCRAELLAQRQAFYETLAALGLRPDLAELRFIDHWITPPFEARRFDTRFFAARAPAQQRASFAPGELVSGQWLRPAEALERAVRGEVALAPPTVRQLHELAAAPDLDAALARPAPQRPIQPQLLRDAPQITLLLPGDRAFDPPGEGVDRIVHSATQKGLWISEGHPPPSPLG